MMMTQASSLPQGEHLQLDAQSRVRQQLEDELARRVREALATPPLERLRRRLSEAKAAVSSSLVDYDSLNAHLDLAGKEREYKQRRRQRARKLLGGLSNDTTGSCTDVRPGDSSAVSVDAREPTSGSGIADNDLLLPDPDTSMSDANSADIRKTRECCPGNAALSSRSSSEVNVWSAVLQPLLPAPAFIGAMPEAVEPLNCGREGPDLFDSQKTAFSGQKWRGATVIFDSLRSPKHQEVASAAASQHVAPCLVFESRFESGNLQMARRVGQFEYELLLKTDLYTRRHTQWYYFRVQNALPGIIYKFRITNFLKKDSLYNYGMKPLFYSDIDAKKKNIGWIRKGHHIRYSLNTQRANSSLHSRDMVYYELEWQIEFENANDTCYMAHCYPYTFTDLKRDLDAIMADPCREAVSRREVLCETKAGNSCFLVTVTDFESKAPKKCVVISARVHPGESNSSWMMKGLLEYITSSDAIAMELRKAFIFKIVPMLNPDGVIIGNYRCDLTGKDLNRNYRWPQKQSFPTVACTKLMIEKLQMDMEVLVYCDLHGHSKKSNVFMYGCNSPESIAGDAKAYLAERLFPFVISRQAPDVFSFPSCKFKIQRKKESTGRVVMYKQMKIRNSFTLEATFSGTLLDKQGSRHFNQKDYQGIGRVFCIGLHEYVKIINDKERETEAMLDLTRALMQRILKLRSANEPPTIEQPTGLEAKSEASAKASAENRHPVDQKSEQTSSRRSSIAGQARWRSIAGSSRVTVETAWNGSSTVSKVLSRNPGADCEVTVDVETASRMPVPIPIGPPESGGGNAAFTENATEMTIDDCARLLKEMMSASGTASCLESDSSSDSDSESEAEMLPVREKVKKKKMPKFAKPKVTKRKQTEAANKRAAAKAVARITRSLMELPQEPAGRQSTAPVRDQLRRGRRGSCSSIAADAAPSGTVPSAVRAVQRRSWSNMLPSISKRNACSTNELLQHEKDDGAIQAKSSDANRKLVKTYQWVNPYVGRTNGGIPCFSERRSLQRAARRMSDTLRQSCKELWEEACSQPQPKLEYEQCMPMAGLACAHGNRAGVVAAPDDALQAQAAAMNAGIGHDNVLSTVAECVSDSGISSFAEAGDRVERSGATGGLDPATSEYLELSHSRAPDGRGLLSNSAAAQLLLPALVPPRRSVSSGGLSYSTWLALQFQQQPLRPSSHAAAWPYDRQNCLREEQPSVAGSYVLARSTDQLPRGSSSERTDASFMPSQARSSTADTAYRTHGYGRSEIRDPPEVVLRTRLLSLPMDLCASDLRLMSRRYLEAVTYRLRQQQLVSVTPVLPTTVASRHSAYLTELLRVHSLGAPDTATDHQ